MNYQAALQYIFSNLSMYQRIGSAAYKAGLDNTHALMELLGHPENNFRSIHVGGTNGKGSTSHMLASVFQAAGYKTALYTSPHLKDFRERIRINGQMISKRKVSAFIDAYQHDFDQIVPSFFEMSMAMAFQWFAEERVDIAIIEVGLGGRLDSTNVITPELSIITNIGLDHTQFLGNTLVSIAKEKAGIIKLDIPVIIGETNTETYGVFVSEARKQRSTIYFADQLLHLENIRQSSYPKAFLEVDVVSGQQRLYKNLYCQLAGDYQRANLLTVIQALMLLRDFGYKISANDIRIGLRNVNSNTGFLGRWTILPGKPSVIFDTGHNEHGLIITLKQLLSISCKRLHIVLGMVEDKNHASILHLFPKDACYYFCTPSLPRGFDAKELMIIASKIGLKGKVYSNARQALRAAKINAGAKDAIFVGGSTFTVADAI